MDEELCFHWGEVIDDVLKDIQVIALSGICRSLGSLPVSALRSHKQVYEWIASQDPITQGLVFNECQSVLASPNPQTCKAGWRVKREREEEMAEIRNIRARLEIMNARFCSDGIY